MQYTPRETDFEKKKMYFFKKGLNTRIKVALSGHTYYTLRDMINKALEMERDRLEADCRTQILHSKIKCSYMCAHDVQTHI